MLDNFIHVPKASGSTIRTILSRQYGVSHILYFEPGAPDWPDESSQRLLQEALNGSNVGLITGHHSFGVHALARAPCRSFAIIRDPLSRAISDYYYAYSCAGHRLRDEIINELLSPESFILDPRFGLQHAQAETLASPWRAGGNVTDSALENVRLSFEVVGVAERFDESVLLTAKYLGWKPPLYVRRNVTKLDAELEKKRRDFQAAGRLRFAEFFAEESRFYENVNKLLGQKISAEGEAFKNALQKYQEIQDEIEKVTRDRIYEPYAFADDDKLPEFVERFIASKSYREIEEYLAAGPPAWPEARNYVGCLDPVRGGSLRGWALDLRRSSPIQVSIYRSGTCIASMTCDRMRPDVAALEGYRAEVGFELELAEPVVEPTQFSVCFEDTMLPLDRIATG